LTKQDFNVLSNVILAILPQGYMANIAAVVGQPGKYSLGMGCYPEKSFAPLNIV